MSPPITALVRRDWRMTFRIGRLAVFVIGAGFAFLPARYHSARAYDPIDQLLNNAHITWQAVGWLFLLAGMCILLGVFGGHIGIGDRTRLWVQIGGHYLAAVLFLAFSAGFFYALAQGVLDGFPALVLWPLAFAVHFDAVKYLWGRRKER